MAVTSFFPPYEQATEEGLIQIGGKLDTKILYEAYSLGIFPWPLDDLPLLWFFPPYRGIIHFDNHPRMRRLNRYMEKENRLEWSANLAFEQVITQCQRVVRKDRGTWITDELKAGFVSLHRAGFAHSLEIWEQKNLVAGTYGVYVKGVWSGESLFTLRTRAGNYALWILINRLKQLGLTFIDSQMLTPLSQSFGGQEISAKRYLDLLRKTQVNLQIEDVEFSSHWSCPRQPFSNFSLHRSSLK